jgi:hypothetical protein
MKMANIIKNKELNKTIISVVIIAVIIIVSLSPWGEADAASKLTAPAFPHVARKSDTALTLSWKKVPGAAGYEVHRYDSAAKTYKKVATIRNGKKVKWTDKKLKTGKKYIYKIRAYANSGFKKKSGPFTYKISAVPYKRNAKTVNAAKNLKGVSTIEIGLKQKLQIDAAVTPAKFGTAKLKKVVDTSIRLIVNDVFVKKDKDNAVTIIGNKVGTTNIYAVAHNGNIKKIKVKVVDYSRPKEWVDLDKVGDTLENILINQYDDLIDVFSYFAKNNKQEGNLTLDAEGLLVNENNLPLGEKKGVITKLLINLPSKLTPRLFVLNDAIGLYLEGVGGAGKYIATIVFDIQLDPTDAYIHQQAPNGSKIAKHWYVTFYAVAG